MLNLLRQLIKPKYETLNRIEIIKQNILDNFKHLQTRQPQAAIFPVLKSNAYGHGLKEICKIVNKTKAPLVVVDSFPEAQIVYRYFKRRVLLLSEMPHRAYKYCKFKRTEFCVYSVDTFKYLAHHHRGAKIHLFVNTGMNREGISDLKVFLEAVKKYLPKLEIVGLCSHLASRDEESELNKIQENKFFLALDVLHHHRIFPRWVHLGNSAGIFTLHDDRLTAYRAGLALYGYSNLAEPRKLKPALRLFSTIIGEQKIKRGDKVSYSETYEAKTDTNIALVPFGYYEGLDRRLSNRAEFLVMGQRKFWAQIAGRVCMNLICLDCANNRIRVGDQVEIISPVKGDPNSIDNLANISQNIPYEVLVKLQGNIHRRIV
jgi:alanine racemase